MAIIQLHISPALLQSIADGDEQSFKTLVQQSGRLLFPYLVKFCRSSVTAEDLLQDIFLKIWVYRDKLPEIKDIQAWIFTIAANTARAWLKRELLHQVSVQKADHPASDNITEEVLQFRETSDLVSKAIQLLPPQRRKIYYMARIEGIKIAEIAAILKIAPSTVKNALASAQDAIQRKLGGWGPLFLLCCFL